MKHAREDYNRIQDPENLIPADEPVFLLRAQDQTAALVVAYWAALQINNCGDAKAARLAFEQSIKMANWPNRKMPDVP
jgi:hypothetical protein